jgi:AmmeMemoRadiSam system protein B
MAKVRQPAVAGTFYPDDPDRLGEMVVSFLEDAASGVDGPKALIAPHAGYVYSGPVAGSAYASLRRQAADIRRVILIGPAHRAAIRGLAAPRCESFSTPLGEVPVDVEAVRALVDRQRIALNDDAHRLEHGIEVHLPFLQRLLDAFTIVPLVAGEVEPAEIVAVLDAVWGGPETLVVISSDLSHYYNYDAARQLDARTAQAIESLAPDRIGTEHACGRLPIQGLLQVAKRRGLTPKTLDLRNSGDTAGPRDEVVGYGAFIFT